MSGVIGNCCTSGNSQSLRALVLSLEEKSSIVQQELATLAVKLPFSQVGMTGHIVE